MNGGTLSSVLASIYEDVPSNVLSIQSSIDDVECVVEVSKLADSLWLIG